MPNQSENLFTTACNNDIDEAYFLHISDKSNDSRDPYSLKNRISGTFGIHFVLASTSHLGRFEHPVYYKSFLNNMAIFSAGCVF
jgi:hypothetical protein